jgi:hypothetical protein
LRSLPIILLLACAPPLLESGRQHCLNSIECEASEKCIAQRCVLQDGGVEANDAGASCVDPDLDGAHTQGLMLQNEELQMERHACSASPDRYRHNLSSAAQVHAWVLADSGEAPALQLLARDDDLPSSCELDHQICTRGGRLSSLVAPRVSDNFDLGVVPQSDELLTYEMGFRVGSSCTQSTDCGSGRCVRPIAESTSQVGNEGICVFSADLSVNPNCDLRDPSSEQPESARDAGELAELVVEQVPLCQHDNDWFAVSLGESGSVSRSVSIRSAAAAEGELSRLSLFTGLYSATDLRPIRFAVLHFASNSQSQTASFEDLSAGSYLLRVTQINRRSAGITYSIEAP